MGILIKIVIIKKIASTGQDDKNKKKAGTSLLLLLFPLPIILHAPYFSTLPASLQHKQARVEGHVAATRKSHRWCLTLTPNNTKTIERMTCHCFLLPIRRDLTRSFYTTLCRQNWPGLTGLLKR